MGAIDERVLERIRRDAGATSVGLLASDLRLKFPTVQKAVDRLIKAGRVERTEDGVGLTTTIEEARGHAFSAEADRRYKAAVQAMPKRHHATKKSSAQLQREIDEVLAVPKQKRSHATAKGAKAKRADLILRNAMDTKRFRIFRRESGRWDYDTFTKGRGVETYSTEMGEDFATRSAAKWHALENTDAFIEINPATVTEGW